MAFWWWSTGEVATGGKGHGVLPCSSCCVHEQHHTLSHHARLFLHSLNDCSVRDRRFYVLGKKEGKGRYTSHNGGTSAFRTAAP
eukprot:30827-Hanusia_phi.AAC.2